MMADSPIDDPPVSKFEEHMAWYNRIFLPSRQ